MRALILSGGAFRTAVQLPIIERLNIQHEYDLIHGDSAGSLNGVMLAQDKLTKLRNMWESINDITSFLTPRWLWPFNGLYSMKPMRRRIERLIDLADIKTPFATGVISLTDKQYYSLQTTEMTTNKELWDAIEASCAIYGLMVSPELIINNQVHLGSDGAFSDEPTPLRKQFTHIDLVTCIPYSHTTKAARNIQGIRARSSQDIEITLYAPLAGAGSRLEVSKKLTQQRIRLGEEALLHPIKL